jgi:hypothetical protein
MPKDYCVSATYLEDGKFYAIYPIMSLGTARVPDVAGVCGFMRNQKDAEDVVLTLFHGRLV